MRHIRRSRRIDEWGYPVGIVVAECPSAGHDVAMLDHSLCGRTGEPRIIPVEMDCDVPETLVPQGLVDESQFEGA